MSVKCILTEHGGSGEEKQDSKVSVIFIKDISTQKNYNLLVENGIAAAQQRGVSFGRSRKPLPNNFDELYERFRQGTAVSALARECDCISESTLRLRLYERRTLDETN